MNEIYTLYNAEFKPHSSDSPDEKFLLLQCEVLYIVPCSFSTERIMNYVNGLRKSAKTQLVMFEQVPCEEKLKKMAKIQISGNMQDVLRAQYDIFQNMQNHKDECVHFDFTISNHSYDVTKINGRYKAENIRECRNMNFNPSKEHVYVSLEGKFFNVQRTFKNLQMIPFFNKEKK